MPPTAADYLSHLRTESARFREALAGVDAATPVPSCPGWDAAALVWHLGVEVQAFWAHVLSVRPRPPADWTEPSAPESHTEVLAGFDAGHAALVAALEQAAPEDPAWTWSEEQTVGFTFRRQAHEALVHRVDAELTAGVPVSPVDPHLAADGVLEAFEVMLGGTPSWGAFEPGGGVVRVDALDAGPARVWLALGRFTGTSPDSGTHYDEPVVEVVPPGAGDPDAVVAGPAAALLLWLWGRDDDAAITLTGDPDVLSTFRACVDQPIE